MALKARDVLNACYSPINALKAGDHFHWETHWTAAITCLRAVGHTLDKVDKNQSDRHNEVISAHWNALKGEDSDHIFWYLDDTRNRLLKEYDGLPECEVTVYGDDVVEITLTLPDESDGMELLDVLAAWWEAELDSIEAEIYE